MRVQPLRRPGDVAKEEEEEEENDAERKFQISRCGGATRRGLLTRRSTDKNNVELFTDKVSRAFATCEEMRAAQHGVCVCVCVCVCVTNRMSDRRKTDSWSSYINASIKVLCVCVCINICSTSDPQIVDTEVSWTQSFSGLSS